MAKKQTKNKLMEELKEKVRMLYEIVALQDKAILALAKVAKELPTKEEVKLIVAEHALSLFTKKP